MPSHEGYQSVPRGERFLVTTPILNQLFSEMGAVAGNVTERLSRP